MLDDIELFVNLIAQPAPQPASRTQRRTAINVQPYRSQAKQLMRETLGYWEEGWEGDPIEEELPDLLAQAEVFSERGEGNTAIAILTAIAQACAEEWDEIAEYGGSGEDVASLIDPVLTEAILCAEFQPGEEIDLQINLEDWEERLDGSFNLSSAALRQGWEDAALQAVLRGESTQLWEDNLPEGADRLARIRLSILDRQGRQEEYLNLARAEGILPEYLTMLAGLGRIEEVMANRRQITSVDQALAVARALRGTGVQLGEALEIAQLGTDVARSELFSSGR
ncbi:MAG: SWIM zinc finger domain-containing protein, partial [Rhodospirillales bacterium]|nr:SWIM zinc finger domain-containing protein [Rhodospirillales bacterium]